MGNVNDRLLVERLDSRAKIPRKATSQAAGLDLRAIENVVIMPRKRELVRTGLSLKIPKRHYGRIAERSGLALNFGLRIGGGVVDRDYRGEVKLIIHNTTEERYTINKGDRVAQLIIEKIKDVRVKEVKTLSSSTERGRQGFGSSGKA
jgi:deoxyuridine 5'-triphosphate nucleotidohydrolase